MATWLCYRFDTTVPLPSWHRFCLRVAYRNTLSLQMPQLTLTPVLRCTSLIAALLILEACSAQGTPVQPGVPPSPFQPIATLQDLMAGEVDPSADAVWDSVATEVTAAGSKDQQPQTPAEWAEVRRNALRLLEATNLLLIKGRHVATTPFAAEAQGALDSAQIEQRIDSNRATFDQFAVALRTTGLEALAAIDKHDAQALLRVGGSLDAVCESCHLTFWYPDQVIPPVPDHGVPVFGTASTNVRH